MGRMQERIVEAKEERRRVLAGRAVDADDRRRRRGDRRDGARRPRRTLYDTLQAASASTTRPSARSRMPSARCPSKAPPLQRENRLYQADWLLRFYGFTVPEIAAGGEGGMLDLDIDPKLAWALKNRHRFPVDVNTAEREMPVARARAGKARRRQDHRGAAPYDAAPRRCRAAHRRPQARAALPDHAGPSPGAV